ncbi:glycoside hydrolase family 88 protein [Belliella sp. R4-6]|uniref:Glycoside hydrolase family 88 protein n=1 Tax=Belliella alkalica TaxID=1730871 RepID=A0ABS9V7X8_9BACT|nr:glycoside hydrolase family 88 protein [Belliella alkalica]MCH7412329.1 glycoside hydrolase family 88 protein [Belliella alkalica]
MLRRYLLFSLFLLSGFAQLAAQNQITDSNTPLHLLQPDYPIPYGVTKINDIESVLEKVYLYLNEVTPARLVDKASGSPLKPSQLADSQTRFEKGDFRLTSYEWGVTYAGMMLATQSTGDLRFADYTYERLSFLSGLFSESNEIFIKDPQADFPLKSIVNPHALDDAGAICAAMIKAQKLGFQSGLEPIIENLINYISSKEYRLDDGTFARNRPLKNTLWLDDLFMSVPALALYADQSGDTKYMDDAVSQVLHFSERMFNTSSGIFRHGWVENSGNAPSYFWARANGWAFMAMVELLSVLPKNHPKYEIVLSLYQSHALGLSSFQSSTGFWHQLLDRNDSYLETSATAIFTYGFAKGINEGWLDYRVYAPLTLSAWNAVASKVNDKGQVEGTCVGTGMGFDPAFYYYRPTNLFAAHSYGPVMLAGSEVISLLKNHNYEIDETAVQFK